MQIQFVPGGKKLQKMTQMLNELFDSINQCAFSNDRETVCRRQGKNTIQNDSHIQDGHGFFLLMLNEVLF